MPFLKTYFSNYHLIVLVLVLLFHLLSIYLFTVKNNTTKALFLLLIGGAILRLLIITFDEFLHPWDEQYHALVAKHLSENPIFPVLYKELFIDFNPNNWTENYVWLHKQPMFLWQMAFSIKIFGNSVLAIRLPSLLMSLFLIPVIYRIGKLIINKEVGFLACLIYATNNYLLDFISGYYNTDHNDVAFIFYVTLSIWVFTEYIYSNNKKYIYLIGLFAGLAILNKWLVGLLVFSGWGMSMFFISGLENKLKELKNIGLAFLVCLATFVPWQIYVWFNFREAYIFEITQSGEHFFKVVEGHSGEWSYYFNQAIEQYNVLFVFLIPLSLVLLYRIIENKKIKVAFIVYVLLVVTFFTIAKTKMPAFCLIISPIIFLALGNFVFQMVFFLEKKIRVKWLPFLILITITVLNIDIEKIQKNHTSQGNDHTSWYRKEKLKAYNLTVWLKHKFKNKKIVIFNCKDEEYIQLMFFNDCLAFRKIPTEHELKIFQEKDYQIVILRKEQVLPDYILYNKSVSMVNSFGQQEIKVLTLGIKASNGEYLAADSLSFNQIVANKLEVNKIERFTFYFYKNNQLAIESNNKSLWSVRLDKKNEITTNSIGLGSWEIFDLEKIDATHFAIKAFNGKYLSLDKEEIKATANTVGENEMFEFFVVKK